MNGKRGSNEQKGSQYGFQLKGVKSMETPWGESDSEHVHYRGTRGEVVFYTTPSHGGFRVTGEFAKEIPEAFKLQSFCGQGVDGWYEEDCDCVIPIYFLSRYGWFDNKQVQMAEKMCKAQYPEAWAYHELALKAKELI